MRALTRKVFGVCFGFIAATAIAVSVPMESGAASVARPPQKVQKAALALVGVEAHGSVKIYGQKSAFSKPLKTGDKVWLIAIQAKHKEYCLFVNARENSSGATEAATFVGCLIYAVEFKDFNGDGSVDALYRIKTKSNVADAWVDEDVLFLSREDGFCKAGIGNKFSSSPGAIKCD